MNTCRNRSGFSMIEVLVASAILVVIVMMLAMLFQQTSLSWRTGVRRADAFMQIRSAIGSIQRDASAAVDERTIPPELRNILGGNQNFSGSLRFYTLTGDGFLDANNNGQIDTGEIPYRALKFVTYNKSGNSLIRTESVLTSVNGVDTKPQSDVLDFVSRGSSANVPKTTITSITPLFGTGPGASAGLPLFITIQADVTYSGNTLEIGTGSAGPDKTWNTKDDIVTWL